MVPNDELIRIIDLLNTTYESEEAWHGPSVVEALRGVTPDVAGRRIMPNTHTIAELVFHMTSWRIFCVKKMQGDVDFDITTPAKDFGALPDKIDDFEWEALEMELSLSQEELINELDKRDDDEFLEDIVPGRDYTYYDMLHGIINHDMYHTGQIVILKKALTFKTAGSRFADSDEDEYGSPFGGGREQDDYY
ncbi:DinB family protein [Spirosoma utsteinense]|uniref:Damage-inducible protein DinB n=1 Tax=Spirosoma utsteinense TaxID=2585773 RepID=A0ABR6WB14_9BACT|nr:DinB family protein [Spirosoma utsteinense]MBC3785770.1 putative damage-inducible protein DinB [Spirosoma utsteinense]MBC3793703.1 putative damage-inducible protein DinB [Spirosoma utsteinense]